MTLEPRDEQLLRRAIELAGQARAHGNHPFGALLVDAGGRMVLEAENTVLTEKDVTGHAELNVVRRASVRGGVASLAGTTLYTSTEPCAMCAGAIYWAGIDRVVYALGADALPDLVGGPAGEPTLSLPCREVFARGGREVAVSGPHLAAEAAAVHDGFWVA